jgi:hypothetical protein
MSRTILASTLDSTSSCTRLNELVCACSVVGVKEEYKVVATMLHNRVGWVHNRVTNSVMFFFVAQVWYNVEGMLEWHSTMPIVGDDDWGWWLRMMFEVAEFSKGKYNWIYYILFDNFNICVYCVCSCSAGLHFKLKLRNFTSHRWGVLQEFVKISST